ncbi:MAG: hypothetical protein GXP31_09995 [Kiritimatiellaeota bacterium]|nr:hypothetical protein [Kiritimatiellota bacterium]
MTAKASKTTFALFFGNRGFFPASLMDAAREELPRILREWGYDAMLMDRDATRHGAVETVEEGAKYAKWLEENRGRYDGVILCLPNFGDETGAVAALADAGTPILIQAYPDELDKMAPDLRRDAFCGKFSIMDVFCQYGVKFTALKPHTVAPATARFRENVDHFARVCRVANGLKRMTVGAVGARTTAFKTVRIDELALQKAGITMETLDLSTVIRRVRDMGTDGDAFKRKKERLFEAASWEGVPENAAATLIKLGVVLDEIVDEFGLDALAVRCWIELQEQLGISPCVLLSELNDRGVVAACEVDVGNAVTMYALHLASEQPAACLDWNNNYGDEDDKCILFHCGPVPFGLMKEPGRVVDHAILANAVGPGCGYGCNVGRIRPMAMTFGSLMTEDGRLKTYLGQGEFVGDPIPEEFFGCASAAAIDRLQDVLLHVGYNGFRHHVSVTPGHLMAPVAEALGHYLEWDISIPQCERPRR